MYPQSHFLLPFVIGLMLHNLGMIPFWGAIVAGLIGMLIDLDHYIYFAIKHKDFNIRHAWNQAVAGEEGERTFVHHSMGILWISLALAVIALFNTTLFWIIAIGYYTHIFLDDFNLNLFGWKKVFKVKAAQYNVNLHSHELYFDVVLLLAVWLFI